MKETGVEDAMVFGGQQRTLARSLKLLVQTPFPPLKNTLE
jgi:hypothetical protein